MTTKKKKSSEVTRLPINDANEVHFQTCVSQQQQQRHLANELENKVWRIFAQGLTTLDLQFLFLPWLGRVGFAKLNLVTRPKKNYVHICSVRLHLICVNIDFFRFFAHPPYPFHFGILENWKQHMRFYAQGCKGYFLDF